VNHLKLGLTSILNVLRKGHCGVVRIWNASEASSRYLSPPNDRDLTLMVSQRRMRKSIDLPVLGRVSLADHGPLVSLGPK
jgi:hypothetical protein